jgi:hypothetical protein
LEMLNHGCLAARQPRPRRNRELRKKIEAMKLPYTDLYGGDAKRVVRLFLWEGLVCDRSSMVYEY